MSVFVISHDNKNLMPCSRRKARLLLDSNKAIITDYKNFTIKLNYNTTNFCQNITIAMDTGMKFLGLILRNGKKIIQAKQISLRQDVRSLLETRKACRRLRRSKLRYRPARFLNRKKDAGWLPPSILSKINNIKNIINKIENKLPFSNLILEVGNFDVQKMMNPAITGTNYQKGQMAGFNEVKAFILSRDDYKCQITSCKTNDPKLHVHHIIYKSNGGTDLPSNLITLCSTHHKQLHNNEIVLKTKKPKLYKEPPFMNNLKVRLMSFFPYATFCYGYETKEKRQSLGLIKSHINDAIAISLYNENINQVFVSCTPIKTLQFRSKKRSLQEQIPRKGRSKPNREQIRNSKNTSEVNGFRIGMKVRFGDKIGHITGFSQKSAYVKDKFDNYLSIDNKNYKQISLTKLTKICYNKNWINY